MHSAVFLGDEALRPDELVRNCSWSKVTLVTLEVVQGEPGVNWERWKWGYWTLCDITEGAFSILWVIRLFSFFSQKVDQEKIPDFLNLECVRLEMPRAEQESRQGKKSSQYRKKIQFRSSKNCLAAKCAPVEEGFCDLNRPTTLLPWKPPERSNTALVRGCFQHTTGSRLCR